MKSEHAVLGFS